MERQQSAPAGHVSTSSPIVLHRIAVARVREEAELRPDTETSSQTSTASIKISSPLPASKAAVSNIDTNGSIPFVISLTSTV